MKVDLEVLLRWGSVSFGKVLEPFPTDLAVWVREVEAPVIFLVIVFKEAGRVTIGGGCLDSWVIDSSAVGFDELLASLGSRREETYGNRFLHGNLFNYNLN